MLLSELVHFFNRRNRLSHRLDGHLELVDGQVRAHFAGRVLTSVFQPVVDAQSCRVLGHETLLQVIAGPGVGLPAQSVFLDSRDDGELVLLDRLCRTLHALNFLLEPQQDGGFLALNVHSQLLLTVNRHHGHAFQSILSRCGLTPPRIVLEIADDGFTSPLRMARAINEYRARGYRVAIDNFGRHSVDLERLEQLAPDIVKLDRSLIGHAGHLSMARRVLTGMSAELQRLGMLSVCQWIETAQQLQLAKEAGATWLQGRLLGRPANHCLPIGGADCALAAA
jgi:EAL domain-containing protein (putative c-di-GMP-specific phosphodiesterase class I)